MAKATAREVPTGPLLRPCSQSTRYCHGPSINLSSEELEDPAMHPGGEILPGVHRLLQEVLSGLCFNCQAAKCSQQQGDKVSVGGARGDSLQEARGVTDRSTSTHLP